MSHLNRIHGLDFARAVLMTLGLTYHIGLIYGGLNEWRVTSDQTSIVFKYLSDFIHMFRMEAFYIISGFFYTLVLLKNRDGFLKERINRALIPMLFGGILFNPIMNFLSYNSNIDWSINYILKGYWLGHLWFLGNLIFYFLISKKICNVLHRFNGLSKRSLMILFCLVAPLFGMMMLAIVKFTFSGTVIFLSFDNLLYYYVYFVLGILCYHNKNTFISMLNLKTGNLLISIILILFSTSILMTHFLPELQFIIKVINKFITGGLALLVLASLITIGNSGSKLAKDFSDASYTIYILHQPLLIILYVFYFKEIQLGATIEYLMLVIATFTISYFIHFSIVKKSKLLEFLFNGTPRNSLKKKNVYP